MKKGYVALLLLAFSSCLYAETINDNVVINGSYNYPQLLISRDAENGIFLEADGASTHYNWLIGQQKRIDGGLEIAPSISKGGTDWNEPSLVLKYNGSAAFNYKYPDANYALTVGMPGLKVNAQSGSQGLYVYRHDDTLYNRITFDSSRQYSKWGSSPIVFMQDNVERFRINESGDFGIGTDSPDHSFHLKTEGAEAKIERTGEYASHILFRFPSGNPVLEYPEGKSFSIGAGQLDKHPEIYISQAGTIGLGTTEPVEGYQLTVNGGIYALDFTIKASLEDTADFVFEDDYNLMPLEEVKANIKANKHLPGVPSAQDMVENGISVSELQTKLLQKVEELTLYMIDQNEKINTQAKQIEQLTKMNDLQAQKIKALNQKVSPDYFVSSPK